MSSRPPLFFLWECWVLESNRSGCDGIDGGNQRWVHGRGLGASWGTWAKLGGCSNRNRLSLRGCVRRVSKLAVGGDL